MKFVPWGFEVTEGVGQTGIVAVLENGPGPTVMLRGDMDGLPVAEDSGLDYESKARQVDITGIEQPETGVKGVYFTVGGTSEGERPTSVW